MMDREAQAPVKTFFCFFLLFFLEDGFIKRKGGGTKPKRATNKGEKQKTNLNQKQKAPPYREGPKPASCKDLCVQSL